MKIQEMAPEHIDALCAFFANVPAEDRTFFKEDIGDPHRAAERWLADDRSVRRVALTDDRSVIAFATLSPGVERTGHVADLRLVVAVRERGQGLGRALARRMLVEALQHGYKKVTVDIAADHEAPIRMFRELGFHPEALLRDQLRDANGAMHDIVILAHSVDERWSRMLTAGMDEAVI